MENLASDTTTGAAKLVSEFDHARPFRHWVVDGFFRPDFARALLDQFPAFERGNARNEQGELGGKSVVEQIRQLGPAYAALDDMVQSRAFLTWLSAATGIPDLRYDPWYFGGGTHENRHGQELDSHIDFNRHPADGSHRRLNLIVYLNDEWQDAWGGSLELHSDPRSESDQLSLVTPLFNRCVAFETTEWSWHGFSRIDLPEEKRALSRKSIALYFYTLNRPQEELATSHSTVYVDRPLPKRFRVGHMLSEQDVQDLKVLLVRRDQHNQRLYRDIAELQAKIDDSSSRSSSGIRRLLALVWLFVAGGLGFVTDCVRARRIRLHDLRRRLAPFVSRLPNALRRPLLRVWHRLSISS